MSYTVSMRAAMFDQFHVGHDLLADGIARTSVGPPETMYGAYSRDAANALFTSALNFLHAVHPGAWQLHPHFQRPPASSCMLHAAVALLTLQNLARLSAISYPSPYHPDCLQALSIREGALSALFALLDLPRPELVAP